MHIHYSSNTVSFHLEIGPNGEILHCPPPIIKFFPGTAKHLSRSAVWSSLMASVCLMSLGDEVKIEYSVAYRSKDFWVFQLS